MSCSGFQRNEDKQKATSSCPDSPRSGYPVRGSLGFADLVFTLALSVAALEALDTSGGVDDLLLAGKERMAGVAELDTERFAGAADLETVAAGAGDGSVMVFWMDSCFHDKKPPPIFQADRKNYHILRVTARGGDEKKSRLGSLC